MRLAGSRGRALCILVVATAVVAGVLLPFAPVALADPHYGFAASGLDGGGFQNVVAYSPFLDGDGNRPLLLGADVAGIHRSLDGGRTWQASNAGLGDPHVASLLFSDTVAGKVYAATDSAIYVSIDFGQHWTARPGAVHFDANGAYRLSPGQEHPRSTGQLLALGHSGGVDYLYAATATQGVKRSGDDGATWAVVALVGSHLRSLALDPADPNHLFVGSVENGLQESRNATTAMTFARVSGGPAIPEEMRFIGGPLYVAGGTDGIFRYDGAWQPLNTGIPSGPAWESITGYVDAGQTVLYVGCAKAVGGAHTMKSTDGGVSWTSITTGTGVTVESQEFGTSTTWWAAAYGYLSFTGTSFVTSDIAVDPDDAGRLVVAGRGGAYVGVQDSSGIDWSPSMRGLMVTVDMMVAADPKLPGRVYVGNMDFTFFASADGGRTFARAAPSGSPGTGDEVVLDPDGPAGSPSTVYLAVSRRGKSTGTGKIYSNPDPVSTPSAWTDEALPVSNDVAALGVGHSAAGSRIILAAVDGKGLYRKDGVTWSKVGGTAPFATPRYGSFAWVPGTPTVYAVDGNGLWRSDAAGATGSWVRLSNAASRFANVSSLAVDPMHPGVLYVSDTALGGVVRLAGANTAKPTITNLLPMKAPGPIAVTPDGALLAVNPSTGALLRASAPASGTPLFADVGDDFFHSNDSGIRSLAVGPDGSLFTASNQAGVSLAPPLGLPAGGGDTTPPSTPAGLTAGPQTATSVSLTWTSSSDDVGLAGYRVLRDGTAVGWVPASDAPGYTDTGLSPSTSHSYTVAAVDTSGNASSPSDPLTLSTLADTTPPSGPSQLTARVVSPTQVALSWPAATDDVGVTGYQVSRNGVPVATATGLSFDDTVAANASYTYAVTAQDAAGHSSPSAMASVTMPPDVKTGLTGTYFDTATLTTQKLVRIDPTVNFAWGTGSPSSLIGPDTFSARWTGEVIAPAAGSWTFVTQSDNGVRLWVDNVQVINDWTSHALTTDRGTVFLSGDRAHVLKLEYYEQTGSATMKLLWSGPGVAQQVIPQAQLLSR